MTEPIPPRPSASLTGKVAVVTGAGAAPGAIGNGRATAILLAEAGCAVVCVDLKLSLAEETVEMIEADGLGHGVAMVADVTKAEDCQRIVDLALSTYGRLDILVNNVGVMGAKGSAVEVDLDGFMDGLRINVASMVQMAKVAIPAMAANAGPCAGSIVNMSSVAGLRGGTPHLLYPTSKGAIVNMTRAMAANHAAQRIRVNCVCPGMVYTPMMYQNGSGMSRAEREARKARSLLQTEGNGWDVGAAVRFLASDLARWVTGVVLPVDAGTTAATGVGMQGLHTSNLMHGTEPKGVS
ncbi:short-chain dehydrogenase/reductase SDR [Aspergillus japonicus CBS 114.51]|uniref:Short-chain dehydrogenase/reductase SDR n=1 Tax=Aspergillus japonicus CBS 114.51 TaxID=1448312 RepID=A0A8T8WWF5_ASPJA|nr:short-chain dehydrogenase/reductase SDR [Aspergillus japonicus CBS 114.51]RAH79950.1 short-chain dehydrogenase/reductase SDR [Aspergillus japonicus CBS 114.51]